MPGEQSGDVNGSGCRNSGDPHSTDIVEGDPGIVNIVSVASLAGPGRLRHLVRDVRCRDDGLRQRLGLTASALLGWRNDLAGRGLFDVPGEGRVWADGAA